MLLLAKWIQDISVEKTRHSNDSYTSIKVPNSIRKHLRVIAAKEDRFVYQVLADMILAYIDQNNIKNIKTREIKHTYY